ncbi:N2,N2-dimethylguanosine tRNA methyltransferase [Auricularia subglabra TFB-10046 SS5]|nr:N2,N2-dimethylguanosine tRNA methyltransferase [Auricularia subglabra TFB-10046 SS5]
MSTSRIVVPDGFTLHVENSASILLPAKTDAFINPIQEFNRDLSVACISMWADDFNRARLERAQEKRARQPRKKRKVDEDTAAPVEAAAEETPEPHPAAPLKPRGAVILEALSATGLRSIRYGKEIPGIRYILANDLSPAATAAMRRNVDINGLGPHPDESEPVPEGVEADVHRQGKVRVTESDAVSLMYSLRTDKTVDCIDLDPYGTASPFIDGAVQCVNDGGLLCVTCTDMAVLASNNYPEKCYANYGGIPAKAEYCHEASLRLLLHALSTSAARYGRFIKPLLSLSIDFYIRVFVRVQTSPLEVKNLFSKTAVYYVCSGCQAFYEQPLGRVSEKVHESSGNVNLIYRTQPGPPTGGNCEHCGFTLHVAGPMWSGPLHDREFVGKVFEHTRENQAKFGTAPRMMGMLTLAREELTNPFYFTPSRVASYFQCESPSYETVASALLNAGHAVTRSHALAGSFKTNAPISAIHDIFRGYIKTHPVKMEKIKPGSPAAALNAKEAKFEADFKHNPKAKTQTSSVKIVRYQHNPTPNWGPGMRPSKKRKAEAHES